MVANGGAASASDGVGGSVGGDMSIIAILSNDGPVITAASYTLNGGDALATGGTGGAGVPTINVMGTSIQSSGNISANGGNGDLQGGDGTAQITFFSTVGAASQTGTVTAQGGTGKTPGANGVITVQGQTTQP